MRTLQGGVEWRSAYRLTIAEYFSDLKDPRVERTKRHKLLDIIVIAICAVVCGADEWTEIERQTISAPKFDPMLMMLIRDYCFNDKSLRD